jgi:hypothetical protein
LPAQGADQARRWAYGLFVFTGLLTVPALVELATGERADDVVGLQAVVGGLGLACRYAAGNVERNRVVVSDAGLAVGRKLIPWSDIARIREKVGFGLDLLDADRVPLARLSYRLEGFDELLAEVLRHRPDLAPAEPLPFRIDDVSVNRFSMEIAAEEDARILPLRDLSQPWLRVVLVGGLPRLGVSVAWRGAPDGRVAVPARDPIKMWAALRAAVAGPSEPLL